MKALTRYRLVVIYMAVAEFVYLMYEGSCQVVRIPEVHSPQASCSRHLVSLPDLVLVGSSGTQAFCSVTLLAIRKPSYLA